MQQSGRIEEEIEMLRLKLKQVEEGMAFGGKRTKMARSQGKKVHIGVEKEYSRLVRSVILKIANELIYLLTIWMIFFPPFIMQLAGC